MPTVSCNGIATPTMTQDLIFKTKAKFQSVTYDKDTDTWYFYFANQIHASSSGFWRLTEANKIILVSLDHRNQFGLPQPMDLVESVTKHLSKKTLTEIKVDKDTADMTLLISDEIKIQIFIASSGYETYEFCLQDKRYIGLGTGKIGIVEATSNPQIFTTRQL